MPKSCRNRMKTPEEKEKILLEHYNHSISWKKLCKKYDLSTSVIYSWDVKYREKGIDGLKSNTGKKTGVYKGIGAKKPKNKIEELELELLKKDIEIARLKKGYMVKGVGQEKEFVTIFDKNIK